MSKIGKLPVLIPQGVTVVVEGRTVKVTGPKGTMERTIARGVEVKVEGGNIIVSIAGGGKSGRIPR